MIGSTKPLDLICNRISLLDYLKWPQPISFSSLMVNFTNRQSANNVNLIFSFWTITPWMLSSCLIWVANVFQKEWSPCRTPRHTWKRSAVDPLFKTQLDMFVQKVLIHCKKYVPKLTFSNTFNRNVWSSESKAFSKSIASSMPDLFVICANSRRSSIVDRSNCLVVFPWKGHLFGVKKE